MITVVFERPEIRGDERIVLFKKETLSHHLYLHSHQVHPSAISQRAAKSMINSKVNNLVSEANLGYCSDARSLFWSSKTKKKQEKQGQHLLSMH